MKDRTIEVKLTPPDYMTIRKMAGTDNIPAKLSELLQEFFWEPVVIWVPTPKQSATWEIRFFAQLSARDRGVLYSLLPEMSSQSVRLSRLVLKSIRKAYSQSRLSSQI